MILKKPYAFLIRNFRMIHFILSIILILVGYKTKKIYDFFVSYIKDNNYINENYLSVGFSIYLAIIIVLIGFILIFVLMNKKEKPTKYYFICICGYILLILVLLFASSQLYQIEINQIDKKTLVIAKDLLLISYIYQLGMILVSIFRTIGFNIKKFGFEGDLKELQIEKDDNEEFEFNVEFNTDNIKTKFRRTIRIMKYVLKENKLLVTSVLTISLLITICSVLLNVFVYNKIYKENQTFKVGDLAITVLNSYKTKNNYNSVTSLDDDYIYNIVDVKIKNNGKESKSINNENVSLKIDKTTSQLTEPKIYEKFIDLGIGYNKQKIAPNKTGRYIFAFKVKKGNNNPIFRFLISVSRTGDNEFNYNYKKVKLSLKNLDEIEKMNTVNIGETLKFNDNIVYNTSIKIDAIEFKNVETYKYSRLINNKKYDFIGVIQPSTDNNYGRIIMKIKANIVFDDKILNPAIESKFIEKFANIRYVKDGIEYKQPISLIDSTPEDDVTDYKYIEILDKVGNSDKIYLDFTIRNKQYTYVLK